MAKLIITEKPSVGRDIAKVLKISSAKEGYFEGNGYVLTWAFGHLLTLSHPEAYDDSLKKWSLEQLPILPDVFKKQSNPNSEKQLQCILKLLARPDIQEVICATDAGREGELIFRWIYEEAHRILPIKRLWISSQTDQAILEGFQHLKEGEEFTPLYHSALSRAEADWLVGMNATRAYTSAFSRGAGVLSVGRVQTPVLKMIVDRYIEHMQFKPTPYYELHMTIQHPNGVYQGIWFTKDSDRLFDKVQAMAIENEIKALKKGKVLSVEKKDKIEKPPLLYDLTELQKEANRRFKFSADHTLKLAQSLYEKHKVITYPRTSSRYLSSDMVPKLKERLQQLKEIPEFLPFCEDILAKELVITSKIVDDQKVTDHHAIIVTEKKPILANFLDDERRLFELIAKRFISVFLKDCHKELSTLISGFGAHTFKTTGTVIQQAGWRAIYGVDEEDGSEDQVILPLVLQEDEIVQDQLHCLEKQTKAPPLHTEASILAYMETAGKYIEDEELRQAMKDRGIGTPATRAAILERLVAVQYIQKDKQKLIPTAKGIELISLIKSPELVSPELTGDWEFKLNQMTKNQFSRVDFMKAIQAFTAQIIQAIHPYVGQRIIKSQAPIGSCPVCKVGSIIEGKLAYGCTRWKSANCSFKIWKEISKKNITLSQVKTLLKQGKTKLLKGFVSKAGKPFDAGLMIDQHQVKFWFEPKSVSSGIVIKK